MPLMIFRTGTLVLGKEITGTSVNISISEPRFCRVLFHSNMLSIQGLLAYIHHITE